MLAKIFKNCVIFIEALQKLPSAEVSAPRPPGLWRLGAERQPSIEKSWLRLV